jgi:hypothetical protein
MSSVNGVSYRGVIPRRVLAREHMDWMDVCTTEIDRADMYIKIIMYHHRE